MSRPEFLENLTRRRFVKALGLSGVVASAAAACAPIPTPETRLRNQEGAAASSAPNGQGAGSAPQQSGPKPTPKPAKSPAEVAAEMDAMHEAGIKAYPAKTERLGNQLIEPEMDGDVKVFKLTASVFQWEVEVGKFVEAWGYNEQIPGPQIRVTEGDKVRVIVTNNLPESHGVHWHGLLVPNNMDGVPFITQPPIKTGETFTYEFVARNPGSHMYHSHHNSAFQTPMGLLGAFIIEEKYPLSEYSQDHVIILNDGPHGFTINGKGFPATEAISTKLGEKIRIRYMNEGLMIHPMHLHGMPQRVIAIDGWPHPTPYLCDTPLIAPGQRVDVAIDCTEPGVWAWHCHILSHAESSHGMFGMVMALIVATE